MDALDRTRSTIGRVYTIGHGGRTPAELVGQLRGDDVRFLIDVRSAPYSRYQPEFSRDPLSAFLSRGGIKYVFMGDLLGGRPPDPDCYTDDGKVDYRKCRTKDFFRRGIQRVRDAYDQGLRVCLFCSEGKPWECHRSKLVGAALGEEGIEILHVLPDGSTRTQDDVLRMLTGGQADLFGNAFTSRKAYL